MGREVRKVPANWSHPKDEYRENRYKPLYPGEYYTARAKEFLDHLAEHGLQSAVEEQGCPDQSDYMPDWPESERTHYMMYEDTSEGTPISPAFDTPEKLARWLADNGSTTFGDRTATYEQWLPTCRGAWAPSMVMVNGVMQSGVEFAASK